MNVNIILLYTAPAGAPSCTGTPATATAILP
jgi:hypothetical protein